MADSQKRKRPRKLNAREVRELLETVENKQDAELSEVGAGEARLFSDGRLLFKFEDGKGIIYDSRDQVTNLLREVETLASQPRRHPAAELLPQGKDFPRHVAPLVEQLPKMLEVPPESLDRSEESLDILEEKIRRGRAKTFLTAEKMSPLVAYVGEVIRKATKGTWQMHQDPNDGSWEPLIVDSNGRIYQPFALVYGELRLGNRGSIRGAVNGATRAHLLSTDNRKPS